MEETGGFSENAQKNERINNTRVRGMDLMRDPKLNKGLAFTIHERQLSGIHGLLPPAVFTQEQQVRHALQQMRMHQDSLDRYIYLMSLQDRNEKLFYHLLTENVEEMMPLVYTPTVGLACQKYGLIFRKSRGVFITIHDKGHIYDILGNWPEETIKAIVVTDGQRILGLGDLGCHGMGIPVGKLSLYTALAGVNPQCCLPVLIDVGTDNEDFLNDPLYIGLRQKRIQGQAYYDLLEEFMQAVVMRYGQNTLIQFEDFGNANAFRLLNTYRNKYCTFNDDIQGTASVAVAGIIASLKITRKPMSDNTFLFQGAGEAALGIANLLVMALMEEGLAEKEAVSKIWLVDSKGLVVQNRESGGLTEHKLRYAQNFKHLSNLEDIVRIIKPTAIIGVAAQPGVFTETLIKCMSSINERPIIFALSNPTSKAECTAEQAYIHSKGRAVFASGSPFDPVLYDGVTYYPGQGNNAYIFPGLALAVIACGIRHIDDIVFLKAAQALANLVTQEHLNEGRMFPPLRDIRDVSTKIAVKIAEYAFAYKVAFQYPEPVDKEQFIKSFIYKPEYDDFVPVSYDWPVSKF